MNLNFLTYIIINTLLTSPIQATLSQRPVNFECLKQFSGEVSYNDEQLTSSLMVRFRTNYHCYDWCDYYFLQISPDAAHAKKVLGMFDLSKPHSCSELYNQYYAPKAMIRTNGTVKTFSTPVDESAEVSGWVSIENSMKFNNTHWKIVLNKPIEMIQVPLMYQDRHQKLLYTRFDFQDPVLQAHFIKEWGVEAFAADKRVCKKIHIFMKENPKGSNEVLLFNPEYTLVINHQCLMAIKMLDIIGNGNEFHQERCLSLEKNDWQPNNINNGWHDTKQCTHDDIWKRKRKIDTKYVKPEYIEEDEVFCKTLPFRKGDDYVSCEDGQMLHTVPEYQEDLSVKIFFAFAKSGVSTVPFVGNVLAGIVGYLEDCSSLKTIAIGVAKDLKVPVKELLTKADIINKLKEALSPIAE